ncbi:M67 family metallopeptidase [Synechococcus sp. H55.7]|uniref:M67 family metallopeptidase n=1 Tax=unclassified Synechococcus TaxID=2626047 RepID=UPI0039C3364A
MALHLSAEHLRAIRQQGEQAFPYEGCGILIGELKGSDKIVHELWPAANTWDQAENPLADGESSRRRFLIEPAVFKRANDHAVRRGLGILGTYHSHPNHAAIPSEFDRQHAFPWGFSCVIVSVREGKAEEVVSWVLDEQEQPQREPMQILEDAALAALPVLAG